jgi:glycosyltransferase involved in cell wall biosynthesis
VETHFNQIIQLANRFGVEAMLVSAQDAKTFWRRIKSLVVRGLDRLSVERAIMWDRGADAAHLEHLLRQTLKRLTGHPVTIYAQDPLSTQVALAVRKERSCRVVAVVHFNISEASEAVIRGWTAAGRPLWRTLMQTERQVLPRVDQLIFVSDFMRRVVNERIPELANLPQSVISNFVSLDGDKVDSGIDLSADMIAIGTLEPRKNQGFLLRVLSECNARGKRYTLTIVGDGQDRQRLQDLASELGVSNQVRFLGFQPNAARLIPRHRLLVHASQMENLSIVLIEALAYKRPILAPPVGGMPEVFTNGQEGFYWNLDDPRTAADRLVSVLDDREKWQRMSDRAWETFVSRFHPDVLGKRWMEALLGLKL